MVHVVLLVEQVDHAEHLVVGVDNRLANSDSGVHNAFFVRNVDLPVDKSPQEVAFAELQDADRAADLFGRLIELFDHS